MKKYQHLSSEQRYTIALLLQRGESIRSIALCIGVSASTVSRELRRNKGKRGYSYLLAHMYARERILWRKRRRKLNAKMESEIRKLLIGLQWSPEQISNRLRQQGYPMVGKSSIYAFLHKDKAKGGELYLHCRHQLKYRKQRLSHPTHKGFKARKTIEQRPDIVAQQGRMGDLEMDLICGTNGQEAILTLVDRKTDYAIIRKLPSGRKAKPLARVVNKALAFLKRRGQPFTITTDNGSEFMAFRSIEKALGVPVYFARPYRSTDKPHIEHLNALIRQYIPKGTSFAKITDKQIRDIEWKLNNRPRKKLNYKSPFEVFFLNLY